MANRAYLFSSDSADHLDQANWVHPSQSGLPYYDSRQTVPYAWYFLFRSADVKRLSAVNEIRLVAPRQPALTLAATRRPFLQSVAASPAQIGPIFEEFLLEIASWKEQFLWLDPSEIVDDHEPARHCLELLSCIESGDVAAFRRAASSHSTFEPTGTSGLAMASVGVTYRSCAAEPTER